MVKVHAVSTLSYSINNSNIIAIHNSVQFESSYKENRLFVFHNKS